MTPSDVKSQYDSLKVKAIRLQSKVQHHKDTAIELKSQYQSITDKLSSDRSSLLIQETSIQVIKEIIDSLSQEHIQRICDLITYGLKTIFFDRDYQIEVLLGDKRSNKTAELFLVEDKELPDGTHEIIRSSFNDSIGGGVVAVVGVILQVFYLGYLNQAPILFMDESLSQVSSEYIPNLMSFIKELANQKGFIFVLVSHDTRIVNYADRKYLVEQGVVTEVKAGVSL